MSRPNLIYMTEIETPYRQPVLEELCKRGEWNLRIAVLSERQQGRSWSLARSPLLDERTSILSGVQAGSWGAHSIFINRGVAKYLKESNPDLVFISGYSQPAFWVAREYCKVNNIPFVTITESHFAKRRSRWITALKNRWVRRFYSGAAAHLATGTAAKNYVMHYGAQPERVFFFPNTIDVSAYARQIAALRSERQEQRKRFGMKNGPGILYVGHLAAWKGVETLVEAFAKVRTSHAEATLHLVGDGPEGQSLRRKAQTLPTGSVIFHGFQQPDQLLRFYSAADLFVLPSIHETWGVVVLEAMAAGLPIICSSAVGSAEDLVESGMTGFTFEPGDVGGLKGSLERLLEDSELRKRMANAGLLRAQEWSIHRALDGFTSAAKISLPK